MTTTPLVVLGAGGHAAGLIDILREQNARYRIHGILNQESSKQDKEFVDIPILGDDTLLPQLRESGIRHAVIGVGGVGPCLARKRLYESCVGLCIDVISVIHPTSVVYPSARYGPGAQFMAGTIIGSNAVLHENVLLNNGAIVEHHCHIDDHVHVATGARLCGNVHVGPLSFIGAGAVVKQGVRIGQQVTVGAGAVVIHDVPDHTTVVGVPAHPVK